MLTDDQKSSASTTTEPSAPSGPASPPADDEATLRRMERMLAEIRNVMDTRAREETHQEFSPARLIGALAQVLAIGFFILALAGWFFAANPNSIVIELGFCIALQLGAIAAAIVVRNKAE